MVGKLIAGVFSLPEEKAEEKKIEVLSEYSDSVDIETVSAVKPLYGELLEELRKVMQFFLNRSGTKDLNQIYLMGGGASLVGLSDYLSEGLGFQVDKFKTLSSIQLEDNKQEIGTLVNAAGAIIRL